MPFIHRDLESNNIEYIHPDAFLKLTVLEDLNLGNNVFPHLPHHGLHHLLHIKTFNNPNLREFPPVESFPRIKTLVLSYAYHCCAFVPMLKEENNQVVTHLKEKILFSSDADFDSSMWNMSTDIWSQLRKCRPKHVVWFRVKFLYFE
jgi:leucine-rich repeat-containing G protein-coupled receptor 6